MLIKKIVSFFTSLRLTVTLLAFSIALVFIGTLAQADDGLYAVQAHYFKAIFAGLSLDPLAFTGMTVFGYKIPLILPGGYLLGTLLLINLVAAHIYRFKLSTKKIGIQILHAGVILLLLGQLMTDLLAHETQMHFDVGETRNYSDSSRQYELVFESGGVETVIPTRMLKTGGGLKIDSLPFTIRVESFWKNSDLNFRAPMVQNAPPLTTNGLAMNFDFRPSPLVKAMDQQNIPTAVLEFSTPAGPLGTWVASDWAGDEALVEAVRNGYAQMGPDLAQKIAAQLVAPQAIAVNGRKFTFTIRPARSYYPFSMTLLQATHTVYPGTDIPKDFRSRVLINNPKTGEHREVVIYMNHPLRYDGLTFYQYQMDAGQAAQMAGHTPSSVLQVVHNPIWLTPYVGCVMVGVGLLIQFLQHLVGFISKRKVK